MFYRHSWWECYRLPVKISRSVDLLQSRITWNQHLKCGPVWKQAKFKSHRIVVVLETTFFLRFTHKFLLNCQYLGRSMSWLWYAHPQLKEEAWHSQGKAPSKCTQASWVYSQLKHTDHHAYWIFFYFYFFKWAINGPSFSFWNWL